MDSTSASLLIRIRSQNDNSSWQRFVNLYTPMIYRWACGIGLPKSEASDLVQEVFVSVLNVIPSFEYDQGKSFRAWLKTVTVNRAKDFLRRRARQPVPDGLEGAMPIVPDEVEFLTAQEYNEMLTRRALEFMQSEFESSTWRACWMTVVDGESAAAVSARIGISENAVYLARSRVLRRLRGELDGLLDENRSD